MDDYVKTTAADIHNILLTEHKFDMNIHELEHLVKFREKLWVEENIDADIEVVATDHENPEQPTGVALVWERAGENCHKMFWNS